MDRPPLDVVFYPSCCDPSPVARCLSWDQVCQALSNIRPISGDKEYRKAHLPLWSPVRLKPGMTRCGAAVVHVSALVMDYDEGMPLEDALARWDGVERIAHTTWSHATETPRCRVVMPLARPVPGAQWSALYAWVLAEDQQTGDAACKDPSRQFYLPALGAGGPHEVKRVSGGWLDFAAKAADLERERLAELAATRARARERAAAIRRCVSTQREQDREMREALKWDANARSALGLAVGANVVDRPTGQIVKGAPCPGCSRMSVWWPATPVKVFGAMCEHRNSCGWYGSLWDYQQLF